MKRYIFFLVCTFTLVSCASTTPSLNWSINGDVTAYNMDGSILRKWDNVIIESGYTGTWVGAQTTTNAIKSFGINFTDPKTGKNIIISNAVPCIIEYSNKKYEVAEKENQVIQDEALLKLFKSGEIFSFNEEERMQLENIFISGIKSDLNSATTKQEIIAVKEKLDALTEFHDNMPKRGSYYEVHDSLISLNLQYKRKAKKLGVDL